MINLKINSPDTKICVIPQKTGRLSNTGLFKPLPPPEKTIQIKENKQNKRRVKMKEQRGTIYIKVLVLY